MRKPIAEWAIAALLSAATAAHAGTAPSLTATPHQVRTKATDGGLIRLWDTSWWITVTAARGDAPLVRIEYTARFRDTSDPRSVAGAIDVSDADRDGISGRIVVTCPSRPDYDRKVRVKARVADANGVTSEWTEMDFPVRNDPYDPVIAAMPVSVATPQVARTTEMLGTVEAATDDRGSIGEVKEALKRQAREKGGDAAVNFRMVSSDAEHVKFAADVVRYADAPHSTPTSTPVVAANPERVLGEIAMPVAR